MGMRAGIIYRNRNEISTITSVQWSTRIDQTLGHYIANSSAPVESVRILFSTITESFSHISALETKYDEDKIEDNDYSFESVYVKSIQEFEYSREFTNIQEAMESHLNSSSIGAIFDENNPEFISFYFENPYTEEIEVRNRSIASLGNFYNNVKNNPRKLKRFSFRNN